MIPPCLFGDEDSDDFEDAMSERFVDALMSDEPDRNGWMAAWLQGYAMPDVIERATSDRTRGEE